MIPLKRNIVTHVWFLPEGTAITSPSAATISANGVWPDAAESTLANFKLAHVKKFTKSAPGGTRVEEWDPGTGRLQLEDVYFVKNNFKVMATVTKTYAIAYGLLLNAAAAMNAAGSALVPNSGLAALRGLAKCQQYDQEKKLIAYWDVYAVLTLPNDIDFDPESGEGTPWQFSLELIGSVNNAGSIVTPA